MLFILIYIYLQITYKKIKKFILYISDPSKHTLQQSYTFHKFLPYTQHFQIPTNPFSSIHAITLFPKTPQYQKAMPHFSFYRKWSFLGNIKTKQKSLKICFFCFVIQAH